LTIGFDFDSLGSPIFFQGSSNGYPNSRECHIFRECPEMLGLAVVGCRSPFVHVLTSQSHT
jgi:hypothetical protein